MRRWFERARLRLRSLVRGSDVDAALQREIRQHLEEQIAENVVLATPTPCALWRM